PLTAVGRLSVIRLKRPTVGFSARELPALNGRAGWPRHDHGSAFGAPIPKHVPAGHSAARLPTLPWRTPAHFLWLRHPRLCGAGSARRRELDVFDAGL